MKIKRYNLLYKFQNIKDNNWLHAIMIAHYSNASLLDRILKFFMNGEQFFHNKGLQQFYRND